MDEVTHGAEIKVLVTGATGTQGGAVARALRHAGMDVAALVRAPVAEPAQALAREGVALVAGDMEDPASLRAACAGRTAVFSVQPAPFADPDSERRQGRNLVEAARSAGVEHLVHSSVSGTGWRARRPDVAAGALRGYWDSKEDVEAMVRQAGFAAYTILKPAFYMENFVAPKVRHMFPHLADGELLVATGPETALPLIGAADLGRAVAAAIADRRRFAGAEIELAGDVLTFPGIAAVIADVTGRAVAASCLSPREVDARMGRRSWTPTQTWFGQVGYPARPEHAGAYGIGLTTFRQWADRHREELRAATAPRVPRTDQPG